MNMQSTDRMNMKRKSPAGLIRILLILLAVIAVFQMPVYAASKKIRLSKTKKTLYTGKKFTLTIKGTKKKVRWYVSGKKLVKLKTKGTKKHKVVVTAKKKKGTCYVVAKVGKKKLRCKITVKKRTATPTPIPFPMVTPTPRPVVKVTDSTVLGLADASLKLFCEASAAAKNGENTLIAPASILTAMAMLENGAGGSTLSELQTALGGLPVSTYTSALASLSGKLQSDKAITYRSANSIWYREDTITMKDAYINNMKKSLAAEVCPGPFDNTTKDKINSWVSKQTNGKIPSILDRIDESQLCFLINALYFNGEWSKQYEQTIDRSFTNSSGSKKTVPMLEGTEDVYLSLQGGEGFVKYYAGGQVAFLGLLPPKGKSVDQYVASLTGRDFANAYANRWDSDVLVYTRMPEFQIEYSVSLNDCLKAMGIRLAFSDLADFSKMSATPLKIDEVLHKTYIKLDKNGTEAAAVTAISMEKASAMPRVMEKKYVYLDRPFVYALIETENGLPLLIGTVKNI